MKISGFAGFVIILSVLVYACTRVDKLPPTPSIKFTSFQTFDTTDIIGNQERGGRLKFYFEDGDGDVGLNAPANPGDDSTNLFFTMFRITNGIPDSAKADDPLKPSDYRIPFLTQVGQNVVLKGTISVTFLYLSYSVADTIKYDFYMKDRAGHVSNTVSTCEIPVIKDTICKGN